MRCLEKEPAKRYPTAVELRQALEEFRASLSTPVALPTGRVTRPVIAALVVVALLAAGAATWLYLRASRARWARQVAMPQIEALVAGNQADAAYRLLSQVQQIIPDDPQLARLTNDVMDPPELETTPQGVDVATRAYLDSSGEWLPLGTTPLKGAMVPFGYRRWRLTKAGYDTRELAAGRRVGMVTLTRSGEVPAGMVYVDGAVQSSDAPAPSEGFWIDRYEVTSRTVQGVRRCGRLRGNRTYWTQPLVERRSPDSLGRRHRPVQRCHRPVRTCRMGAECLPEGTADQPVVGVSWDEAAAYAAYAGKSLPTVLALVPGSGARYLFRHPAGQQLQRKGTGACRRVQRGSVRTAPSTWLVTPRNGAPRAAALAGTSSAARGTNRVTCSRTAMRRIRSGESPPMGSAAPNIRRPSRPRSSPQWKGRCGTTRRSGLRTTKRSASIRVSMHTIARRSTPPWRRCQTIRHTGAGRRSPWTRPTARSACPRFFSCPAMRRRRSRR